MLPSRREGAHRRLHASRSTHNNTSTHVSWRFPILHTQPELGGLEARSSSSTEPGLGIARYPGGLMSVTFVLKHEDGEPTAAHLDPGPPQLFLLLARHATEAEAPYEARGTRQAGGMRVANKYHTLTAETRRRWGLQLG